MYLKICIFGLLFFIYCFIGWLLESIKTLIDTKRFVNRGFLIGPLCPIYGFCGLLIVFLLRKYVNDIVTLFVLSVVICSIVEYFTSYIMEKIFKLRWWDYSNRKYNVEGRICLTNLAAFGILSVIVVHYFNPFILHLITGLPDGVIKCLFTIIFCLFVIDIILSYEIITKISKTAMSIRKDSTEEITAKVRNILVKKGGLYDRINKSFKFEATEKMAEEIANRFKKKKSKK